MDEDAIRKRCAGPTEGPAGEAGAPDVQLARLCAMILEDAALCAGLASIEDQEIFIARIVELGRVRGFMFAVGDIRDAMQATHRLYNARLLVR